MDSRISVAEGTAERKMAVEMIKDIKGLHRITVGCDKGYDSNDFIENLRLLAATPHVARKLSGSAIDERTTRHPGYAVSQRIRKRVEEIFGWLKTVGPINKIHVRGRAKVENTFILATAAYNLVRMRNLGVEAAP